MKTNWGLDLTLKHEKSTQSKHLAHILWYQPKRISKLEDSWVLSNVFHNVSLTWLVEEVASSISMMGPEKISAGYPSYFSCWPVLLGFLVFPQLEQRVSSNIFFLIFGGAQMTSCEGGRSTPNWDLVGSLNPVQPPDPGFLPSGPTSGVSRPQSSSPTMGTECWHDARLTHDTHSLCILSQ